VVRLVAPRRARLAQRVRLAQPVPVAPQVRLVLQAQRVPQAQPVLQALLARPVLAQTLADRSDLFGRDARFDLSHAHSFTGNALDGRTIGPFARQV
jgi:hypothetical protein